MFDDDDDDTFVTIGTCFEIPEDNAPLKKQSKISDQIAVDKQGRRRFHGAFTGGFSAGYFNTVGSKEGWAPSTFVSSRSKRNEGDEGNKQVQRPEDFMDEEDLSEHGIAPRKLQTRSNFKSSEDELSARKRQLKQVTEEEGSESLIGGAMLDELLLPANLSIGIKILKKMGWKPGQGVGEKTDIADIPDVIKGKKVYGCMRPQERDTMDMSSFQKLLAPKDVMQISFIRKDNLHGIGYSGLDPTTAMFGGSKKEEQMLSFKPTGKEKRGIKGQAFGVGAFENVDDDIYGTDSLANYDISMTREDEKDTHGWSGAPKSEYQKGCLHGFMKSKRILKAPLQNAHTIRLPPAYIPRHNFENDKKTGEKKDEQSNKNRLTSKERSLMYGETTKTLEDVNQWALKWDIKKPVTDGGDGGEGGETEDQGKENEKVTKFSSRWDIPIHQERPKVKVINADPENDKKPQAPLYDVKSKTFRPFARYPDKQARYEEFLKAKKEDRDPSYRYDTSVTEWERKREHDEFVRASILYRPLNSMFANRFTPATSADPQNVTINSVSKETPKPDAKTEDDDVPSDKKAANMGMFGKLTRTTHEWHPEKLLCKRFNIAEPYPGSKIRGVPSRDKKSGSSSFFERNFLSIEPSTSKDDAKKENDDEEEEDFTKNLTARRKGSQKKSVKIGPLSHLNEQIGKQQEGAPSIVSTQSSNVTSASQGENGSTKPTIDIFKAIFDNSDSSSNDSSSDDDIEDTTKSGAASERKEVFAADLSKDEENTENLESQSKFTRTAHSENEIREPIGSKYEEYQVPHRRKQKEGPLAFLHRQAEHDGDDRQGQTSSAKVEIPEHVKDRESRKRSDNGTLRKNGGYRSSDIRDNGFSRSERTRDERTENTLSEHRLSERTRDDTTKHNLSKERLTERTRDDRTKNSLSKESLRQERKSDRKVYRSSESETSSEDEWKEKEDSKKSSKKKKKHKHKHKKEKKQHKKKSKKRKKDKKESDSSAGSDDDESLVPSNTLLLAKLKEYQTASGRSRPSAADFM